MPTIKEKVIFNYDGVWSDSFGLISVSLDNGMFDDILIASRELIETNIHGSDEPLHQGFQNNPLEFEMTIAFTEKFTDDKVNDVVRWLFADYYKPLYFLDREDRVFYCMPVGDSRIIHNGLNEGYFTITMRCNSPFVYSPIVISEEYDLSDGLNKTVELFNDGYGDLYPEISIEKIGNGSVSFQNLSNNGVVWEIRNLRDIENVYINCKKEIIKSDMEDNFGVYHYQDTSGSIPKLISGKNVIVISGRCKVQFRYQYKYRF